MLNKRRQSGLTLTEMAVVIAATALLIGLALPAVRAVMAAFESGENATSMISAALSSARALAAKEGRYVGIRFQKAYNPGSADPMDPLTAPQYMIFIVHDPSILANGFRAMEGLKPIKLPDSVGVMDLTLVTRSDTTFTEAPIAADIDLLTPGKEAARDTTTFSIIFSPSGKLLIHEVRTRNRHGRMDSAATPSSDKVFNTKSQVDAGVGMFYQDDYWGASWSSFPDYGLGPELSRKSFVVYDTTEFKKAYDKGEPWSGYLAGPGPKVTYINPYTGTVILKD
ncbi:MAG: hypothetical protein JW720_12060 [Sedimentisphaerales bacterium]|nr:hypothetical protein [Sedimentisphaerales bacterium]